MLHAATPRRLHRHVPSLCLTCTHPYAPKRPYASKALADSLLKSSKLTKLDLSDNGIGEEGGRCLGARRIDTVMYAWYMHGVCTGSVLPAVACDA